MEEAATLLLGLQQGEAAVAIGLCARLCVCLLCVVIRS